MDWTFCKTISHKNKQQAKRLKWIEVYRNNVDSSAKIQVISSARQAYKQKQYDKTKKEHTAQKSKQ